MYLSNFELDNNSDVAANICIFINKAIENLSESVKKLCKAYIKSKYTRIVKSKKMTLTTKRLQEIHANLWSLHKLVSISGKNYISILFNKFTRKLWIFLLRNKNEFFETFKLWLSRAETYGNRLDCLQTDGEKEFISTVLQSFCQEWKIKIRYTVSYMYKENGIVEQCWKTFA